MEFTATATVFKELVQRVNAVSKILNVSIFILETLTHCVMEFKILLMMHRSS